MASDSRWTGGIANREWTRGTKPGLVIDPVRVMGDVRRYLADVAAHRQLLSPVHHPTLKSALKVIYHRSADEAAAITSAYKQAVTHG